MAEHIRIATLDDAEAILAIYTPYITNSIVTAEEVAPSLEEFRDRMANILKDYPWLVCCDDDGNILGYTYASRHQQRSAYLYSVNLSIYVNPKHQRNYVATRLYSCLFEMLRKQGYKNAFAGIIIPNPKSAAFHHSLGFRPVGVFSNVTYKLGHWNDMEWFQFPLEKVSDTPTGTIPFSAFGKSSDCAEILKHFNENATTEPSPRRKLL